MPILGVSSIFMYPRSLLKTVPKAVELGFRHINIFAYPPHFKEDSKEFVERLHKILFDYGLDCSLKIQGYTINIAATNPNLRRKSVEETIYWINTAGDLDCNNVVFRLGMLFYSERVFKEQTFRILAQNFAQIHDVASERGLNILLENYPYPFDIIIAPSDIIRLSKILKKRIYMILNIPHLYDVYKSRRINLDKEINSARQFIKMLYLSEYMNPWDHPHKLDGMDADKYNKFVEKILESTKTSIDAIITIGYNAEEIKTLKDYLARFMLL